MKLIATDLDRTLIPNGNSKEDKNSMNIFKSLLKKNGISLIFITGRPKYLVKDAIERYKLPEPIYCVSMVGTVIYEVKGGRFVELREWEDYLESEVKNYNQNKIKSLLKKEGFKLQSKKYQNSFKLSYYFKDFKRAENVKSLLRKNKIFCNVVLSHDCKRNVGLLDVLHPGASKKKAFEFLLEKLDVKKSEVVYSGDSGNDLSILKSGIKGILVKNAEIEVRKKIKSGLCRIYIAKGNFKVPDRNVKLNGNYVSGIIEGCYHWSIF